VDHNGHPWIQLTMVNLDGVNRDDLTGLWRRGTFDNALLRKADERRRTHERHGFSAPLTLLMIDLDHFSKVNNTYGHPAGDAVLKAVARRIQRAAGRKTDMVCRYGGEEMAVLADEDREGGIALATRILNVIRGTDIVVPTETGKTSLRLTASIGGTVFLDEEDTASRMVARADASLYLAKGKKEHGFWSLSRSRGRNRIVFDETVIP
jgi:diguanylate cyclase (GGDEF)-like protein